MVRCEEVFASAKVEYFNMLKLQPLLPIRLACRRRVVCLIGHTMT